MKIPELHLGHSRNNENDGIIVRNAIYKNEEQLEKSFPHRHSFYVICLIREGSGIHVIDFEEYEVKANRLFIISPLQVHFWKLNSNTRISLIQFSQNILNFKNEPVSSFLSTNVKSRNFIDLSKEQASEVLSISEKLEKETLDRDNFSLNIIRGYLTILSSLIERMIRFNNKDTPINAKSEKMQNFLELIEKNYYRNKGVRYYADKLNITPNYLNMLCKGQFGRSAGEMITVRMILEAKRLLFHTSSDIGEIAFNLSFEDPSYFTRTFKRIEGKSPTYFREEIYKKYQRGNK